MKRSSKRLQILLAVTLLLYACGYLTQFIGNYAVWQKNGGMPGGTSPPFPSLSPPDCLKGILWFPYNLYCIAGCAATVAAIFLYADVPFTVTCKSVKSSYRSTFIACLKPINALF